MENKYTVENLFNLVKNQDYDIIKKFRYTTDRLTFRKDINKFVYISGNNIDNITQKEAKDEISMILQSWKSNKYLPLSKLKQEKTEVVIIDGKTGNKDIIYI